MNSQRLPSDVTTHMVVNIVCSKQRFCVKKELQVERAVTIIK